MVHRGITYRLVPGTKARAMPLVCLAGATRYVWNEMLAYQLQLYEVHLMHNAKSPSTSFFTLGKYFTALRAENPWLQELSFAVVRYTLKYQSDAWSQYFKGVRGRPKFKGKRGDDSFTIPEKVKLRTDHIYIPKVGWTVIRGHNPYPDAKPINATIRQFGKKWYCTITYDVALPEPEDNGLAIGMDRNVGQVTTSTGDIIPLPDLVRLEGRKKRYQRMMARRQKGSNRRKKARYLCAKTQQKIAHKRKDWCHQVSRVCADTASEIVVEDLNTAGMTKSAKGTVAEPGTNVKQKAGLNREILKSGWGQLETYLGYKAHTLTRVPAHHTSQKCNQCGYIDKDNRRTQAQFKCVSCGHSGNADINAALNILAFGIGASGRGGALALATPRSRQNVNGSVEPTVRYYHI